MRVAVTGKHGQVALALRDAAKSRRNMEVCHVGRPDLDLQDEKTVLPALKRVSPDVIVAAAAYTAVDEAEKQPELAYSINASGSAYVAQAAAILSVPVIYISTDYVFDGSKKSFYTEDDQPSPINVYGHTKLAGERAIIASGGRNIIVRTSWVFSPYGKNFVRSMLKLAEDRKEVRVVADQKGTPTSARDIAEAVLTIAERFSEETNTGDVFNVSCTGAATWAQLARRVFQTSCRLGGPSADVEEIASSEFPTLAVRPSNSCLDNSKFACRFGLTFPRWEQRADEVVKVLLAQQEGLAGSSLVPREVMR